jgi:hypothetical protein
VEAEQAREDAEEMAVPAGQREDEVQGVVWRV